jgi:hypothetical protein
MRSPWLTGLAVVGIAACVPSDGPTMRPGDDCLRCHGNDPGGPETGPVQHATPWSLGGTVYASPDAGADEGIEGAHVEVTDENGFTFDLETNLVGNFYSAESVAFPINVCVSRGSATSCMLTPAPIGACNYCHNVPPPSSPSIGSAEGRITAPNGFVP